MKHTGSRTLPARLLPASLLILGLAGTAAGEQEKQAVAIFAVGRGIVAVA